MKVLSNKELSTFCSQMALILRSGISSTEGLSIMLEDAPQEEGQQILKTVLEQIEQTGCLWTSLEEAVFSPNICAIWWRSGSRQAASMMSCQLWQRIMSGRMPYPKISKALSLTLWS